VNSQQTIRLAVIDNDSGFVTVLAKRTEVAGWQQRTLGGAIPPQELVAMKLNALLVDPAVLGEDAWGYLERVCGMLPDLGVVVCTSRSTVAQRVRGLRLGIDDWITKPCHPEEAIARLEAVSRRRRRARPQFEAGPVLAGELAIRSDRFQAFVGDVSLDLTRREFELLQLLADAPGQVLEREAIYQRVWGYAMAHGDRSVDVTSTPTSASATASIRSRPTGPSSRLRSAGRKSIRRRLRTPSRLSDRSSGAFYIFFTSSIQAGNKLSAGR